MVRVTSPVKPLAAAIALLFAAHANLLQAQVGPTTGDDSTVTYPATFFEQYEPFSVSDMLDRIPGINVARGGIPAGGGTSGVRNGPGSSQGSDRRGLGLRERGKRGHS